ncbi:unnamed protein product, partial [Rotaria sp. Silwood1]
WTHILNILDYTQETWWSSILTPSSLITHLSISGQLQSYCDLIRRHELYVEYLTSLITHPQLLKGIDLDESGLLLVLLIKQFLALLYLYLYYV